MSEIGFIMLTYSVLINVMKMSRNKTFYYLRQQKLVCLWRTWRRLRHSLDELIFEAFNVDVNFDASWTLNNYSGVSNFF